MKTYQVNPIYWRVETLLETSAEVIHNLARRASGTLTAYRLLLGRCLLAFEMTKAYEEHGCSSSIHYAESRLGLSRRQALEARRVAEQLRPFASLKLEAEEGRITWSKLREIVRKATPETEDYWIVLAKGMTADQIESLVGMTPEGQMPGELKPEQPVVSTELRCRVGPEIFHLLRQARQTLSVQQNRYVTTAETLEWVLSAYLSSRPLNAVQLDRMRCQTDRDLAAEYARSLPLVEQARKLARQMGYLEPCSELEEPGRVEEETSSTSSGEVALAAELMARALGAPLPEGVVEEWARPGRVGEDERSGYVFWRNGRLRFNPKKRHASRAQRKEILRRDGYRCSTPGCPHFAWLHTHHIVPFSRGGETVEDNLICLCTRCHTNVHQGNLVIERSPVGRLVFKDGKGRRLDRVVEIEVARWLNSWLLEGKPASSQRMDDSPVLGGANQAREGLVAGDWAC